MVADPRHARHERLVRTLEADELDGLLITSRANIRYLTGFSGSAGLAVATRADLLLVTDFRYDEQARADAGAVARVEVDGASVWDRLFRELPSLGPLACIGYEATGLAVKEGERRRLGSEGHPFPTIVASGPRTALPHARSSRRMVAAGEWLLLDFGAQLDGYCADITRTVVVGARATERQRTLYELVQGAQLRARAGVRAGMPGREADALAREVIEARGFGDAFGHSLGHGLGLEVHEAPRLSKTSAEPLPLDAVVTIEPGVYLAGEGGVRIEDDVHLSSEGPVLLTDGRTELAELV